jgi:hypothetical protein
MLRILVIATFETMVVCSAALAASGTINVHNRASHNVYLRMVDHNNSDKVLFKEPYLLKKDQTLPVTVEIGGASASASVAWATQNADDKTDFGGKDPDPNPSLGDAPVHDGDTIQVDLNNH